MKTNFDYLKKEPKFAVFADVAISAEKLILADPEACIITCRRAMEFALKWVYSVEKSLEVPYQQNLYSLMSAEDYRQLVGLDIWKRMDYIRRCGNNIAHNNKKTSREEAMLCLENLAIYMDFIACCYSENYEEHVFNKNLITDRIENAKQAKQNRVAEKEELEKKRQELEQQKLDLEALIKENESLKEALSERRKKQEPTYVPKPLDISEYSTRKLYIDSMLADAG